jgi:hypothetical protein
MRDLEDLSRSPGAGAFLKELWALGAELSPVEVAQKIGFEGVDPTSYRKELEMAFTAYR